MKLLSFSLLFCVLVISGSTACKKHTASPPPVARTVQFRLYTDKDFSHDNHTVTFTAFIRNTDSKIIWDSVLPPMRTKDIPAFAEKIEIEKMITGYINTQLKVGVDYYLQNVGYSWRLFSFDAGETFKVVDFNFQ